MKRTDIVVSAKLTRPKQPVNSRSPKCFTGHFPRCAGDPNTTLGQNRLGMQPRLDNRQGKDAVSASKLIARYHATTPWHVRDKRSLKSILAQERLCHQSIRYTLFLKISPSSVQGQSFHIARERTTGTADGFHSALLHTTIWPVTCFSLSRSSQNKMRAFSLREEYLAMPALLLQRHTFLGQVDPHHDRHPYQTEVEKEITSCIYR